MSSRVALSIALGFGLAPPPAIAAVPASWQSQWDDDACSLVRVPEQPDSIILAIHNEPGTDLVTISLVHKRWARVQPGTIANAQLSLAPGGVVPTEATYARASTRQGPSLSLRIGNRAFLDQLAAAHSLSVEQRGRSLARYSLPSIAQGVASLRACQRDALTSWGIDADAWFKLRSAPRPKGRPSDWVSDSDYPEEALHANVSGKVVVRISVSAAGKATACVPLISSNPLLDRGTCQVFLRGTQFVPARDSEGRAVAAPYVGKFVWLLP